MDSGGTTTNRQRDRGHVLRWPLGLLLVYAGAIKWFELQRFASHVADFGIVVDSLAKPAAWTICVVECLLGFGLLANVRAAAAATAILLVGFMLVLAYGMAIGLDIECGCLGSGFPMKLATQFQLDAALLVWSIFIRRWGHKCR